MISPSYSLTATERVLPRMALDFTTAILDSRVTFARSGNTATVTNSSGVIVGINANLPRFDFNPTTLICSGLLIEEARTNALLNSLIDGTSLATQLVTVTAAARTLSFYGTGTVVLSGAHSATVVGTGAYPTRTTLTFTPSAGVLTLTVTGTVQFAQLETGSFATSFIPTEATAVTRNADVATMLSSAMGNFYNPDAGTVNVSYIANVATGQNRLVVLGSGNDAYLSYFNGARQVVIYDGTTVVTGPQSVVAGTLTNVASSYGANGLAITAKGGTVATGAYNGTKFAASTGLKFTGAGAFNGTIQKLNYWPMQLTNAEVRAFSK